MRVALIRQLEPVERLQLQLPKQEALFMPTLRQSVAGIRNLRNAWRSVSHGSSPTSYGPDGVTLRAFGQNSESRLRKIAESLKDGSYQFQGYRGRVLKKKPSADVTDLKSWRPISIPSVCDRVVQRAILQTIWTSVRRRVFTPASFGGIRRYNVRPTVERKLDSTSSQLLESRNHDKKNVREAAKRVVQLRESGKQWVFETDIENFYPSIDRESLLKQLSELLRDDTLDGLLLNSLDTSITNVEELGDLASLWNPDLGVPQGGVLSPILANLYLSNFDSAMLRENFAMVRYVDDFVVLCDSESEANRAHQLARKLLSDVGLSIHNLGVTSNGRIKTNIRCPGAPFDFLGLTFSKNSIKPTRKKIDSLFQKIASITEADSRATLSDVLKQINLRIVGWARSYNFCNLSLGELEDIDNRIRGLMLRWMKRKGLIRSEKQVRGDAYRWLGVEPLRHQIATPIMKSESISRSISPLTPSG